MKLSGRLAQNKTVGVYRLLHKPTGSAYVGSSVRCVGNRQSAHTSQLRNNKHGCRPLQELWNATAPEEWVFELLEECAPEHVRQREDKHLSEQTVLLNTWTTHSGVGRKLSEETRATLRTGRARYLQDPEARKSLSERAKKQHAAGKLGRQTWKTSDRSDPEFTNESLEKLRTLAKERHASGTFGKGSWKEGPKGRGAKAFQAAMTPEERSAWAKRASDARWAKHRAKYAPHPDHIKEQPDV